MYIFDQILLRGTPPEKLPANALTLTLPLQLRRRSRQKATLENGIDIGIALPQGTLLNDGDLLSNKQGQYILIKAAQEHLLRVCADTALNLIRAAYHLGNRHVALEVRADHLKLEYDPVLEAMLNRIPGVSTKQVQAPFSPETGAYGGGHKHGHDETFEEDYALAQAVYHAHEHAHARENAVNHHHPHDPST
ncbi:MAG: urease accessory protein UreE [Pusillimonas sp.]|nr:urease accessory protein UreE [Pusillimonas sp.]